MMGASFQHQGMDWFPNVSGTMDPSMFAERFRFQSIVVSNSWKQEDTLNTQKNLTSGCSWCAKIRCWRSYHINYGKDFTDGTNIAGLAEDQIPARIRESNCILQAVLCGEGKGYVTHILLKCMLTLPRKKDSKWNIELVKVCEIMKLLRVAHVTQLKKLLKQQHQSVNSAAPNHFTNPCSPFA